MVRQDLRQFLRRYWLGTGLILIATLVFFWPFVMHIGTYSEGGDAMFNAWTVARDHHCILFEHCPKYADGNIYFPNKNTMFYSETQLSVGWLTLPLHFINPNPIFTYNIWTIASFFFAGWFMYLLAKRLSKGNEYIAILAGLAFEFAPFKMAAVSHLQSLSIFYLPLAVLLIIKFLDTSKKRYVAGLFVTLTLLFYGSWYQMAFALFGIAALVGMLWLTKYIHWKQVRMLALAVAGAAIVTAPLALQYIQFSRSENATFGLQTQMQLSSSLYDYILPHTGTLWGRLYYHLNPGALPNSFNLDSFSYHGITLYVTAATLLVVSIVVYRRTKNKQEARERKKMALYIGAFMVVALVGLIVSMGPLLKVTGAYSYPLPDQDFRFIVPLPWLLVDTLLPQLHFIRAIGRASVLVLFGLCCILAYLPLYLSMAKIKRWAYYGVLGLVGALMVFELMPAHRVYISHQPYSYNLNIPAIYKYVRSNPDVDNLIVLRSEQDYPGAPIPIARTEDVLWAGYHNKNIFNGYSGYTPPLYFETYYDFVDLKPDDITKMRKLDLRYVIIDKQLSTKGNLLETARQLFPTKLYEDTRYALFKIEQ